jgi:hypothetical protein
MMDDITHNIEEVLRTPEGRRLATEEWGSVIIQHRLEATLQVTSKDGSKRPHQIFSGFSADLASNTIRNFVDETLHSGDLKSGDKVKIEVVVLESPR